MNIHLAETRKFLLFVNDKLSINQEKLAHLVNSGVVVVSASSTSKALELLERVRFDAVLTDLYRLENGANNGNAGIELTLKIRSINPYIPIIIYTKNLKPGVSQLAATSGATLITTNPIELDHAIYKYVLKD